MLLELADLLKGYISGFHLFQYLTFRTIMSTLTALAVSLLSGPAIIRKLAEVKAGQVIRSDGPQSHLTKAGTPTMGGVLILGSIVAAINLDTVAIAPAGEPVAMLNRSIPSLNALVESTATSMGRRIDSAHEADIMVQRQDGWALARHGVPAIMVGGSFSNMALLNAFLGGRYHKPDDEADDRLVLDGAAEDADLTVALSRRLADPAVYRRPPRAAAQ